MNQAQQKFEGIIKKRFCFMCKTDISPPKYCYEIDNKVYCNYCSQVKLITSVSRAMYNTDWNIIKDFYQINN